MQNTFLLKSLFFIFLIAGVSSCAQKLVNDGIDKSEAAQRYVDAAKAYIEDKNTRKALEHLKRAESFEKKSVELFHTYALLYHLENDVEREEYYYKKALAQDKNNSQVKNNYGGFLCRHDKASKGIKLLKDASEDYAYASRSEAYINRGLCELVLENKEAAEKSFQQSLRLGTQSSQPYYELAKIYFEKEDAKAANMYYLQFVNKAARQDAQSLWLGIRIANLKGDQNAVSSYALSLQKFFPKSKEYELYKQMKP